MEAIFSAQFELSLTASWLIVAIIILRFVLKKVPKNYFCMLWGVVAFRLLCPFPIESIFGLVPAIKIPLNTHYFEWNGLEITVIWMDSIHIFLSRH